MLDNTDFCMFCLKKKTWDSNIRVTDNEERMIFKATVCSECKKKYAINDLFKRYAQLIEDEYKKSKGN